jgi:ABC-type polar amino acid transport system ATPase subunit
MLIAEHLTVLRDQQSLIRDISFTLQPGKIISIIGSSGAGKTTLLKAASLLQLPSSGSLTVGDTFRYEFPLTNQNYPLPYPLLTVVFQQLFLWPHLTLKQNILMPLQGNIDHAYFDHLVADFQLGICLDRFPNQSSIGQRQRAALLRALMLKPRYLMLDEITAALDLEQSHVVISHLKRLAKQDGIGILWVSHAIRLASGISDHILFMDHGKIEEEGPPTILDDPQSSRLRQFLSCSL